MLYPIETTEASWRTAAAYMKKTSTFEEKKCELGSLCAQKGTLLCYSLPALAASSFFIQTTKAICLRRAWLAST